MAAINTGFTSINDSGRTESNSVQPNNSFLRVDTTQKNAPPQQLDYKAKILLFLEMEKLKLLG